MYTLPHVFEISSKTMVEVDYSSVVCFGTEFTGDSFRIEVANDDFEVQVTICDGRKDASDNIDYLMLFKVHFLHDHVTQVAIRIVVSHYMHPISLIFHEKIHLLW